MSKAGSNKHENGKVYIIILKMNVNRYLRLIDRNLNPKLYMTCNSRTVCLVYFMVKKNRNV